MITKERMLSKQAENHVIWHEVQITREDRNRLNRHKSGLIWFTGLSASGKSTIAHGVEKVLHDRGIRTYVLDGDNIRHGLNANLGFSPRTGKRTSGGWRKFPGFLLTRACSCWLRSYPLTARIGTISESSVQTTIL